MAAPQVTENVPAITAQDFGQQALALIKANSTVWNEHHISDPGITILELLCTEMEKISADLALPIKELLQQRPDAKAIQAFFSAEQVLPSNWVTESDVKRLLIDQQGVKNVAIQTIPQEPGRYRLDIDLQDDFGFDDIDPATGLFQPPADMQKKKDGLRNKLRHQFLSQRNVNQDVSAIHFMEKQLISIKMHLSLDPVDDPYQLLQTIFLKLQKSIAQAVPQFSREQLRQQSISEEEIYDGPLLKNGFIRDVDLEAPRSTGLYGSDLLADLNNIEGLLGISGFYLKSEQSPPANGNSSETPTDPAPTSATSNNNWFVEITDRVASFDVLSSYESLKVDIAGQPLLLMPANDFLRRIQDLANVENPYVEKSLTTIELIDSQERTLGQYETIQAAMPVMYQLAEQSVEQVSNDSSWRQLMQLKGYLLLFDQVLADQQAQLANLKRLFALPDNMALDQLSDLFQWMFADQRLSQHQIALFWNAVRHLPQTYLSQEVDGIAGRRHLIESDPDYPQKGFQKLADRPFSALSLQRLKRVYEHLLARFAMTMPSPKVLKYEELFERYLTPLLSKPMLYNGLEGVDLSREACLQKLVLLKQIVDLYRRLKEFPLLSQQRCGSFIYTNAQPQHNFVTGLGQSISRQLGIHKNVSMPLATKNKESFYIIEGDLLQHRFSTFPENTLEVYDTVVPPKSLFFIMPDWPARFANRDFRELIGETISVHCPIHQQALVSYLPRRLFSLFERLYYAWLNAITQLPLDEASLSLAAIGQWNKVNNLASQLRMFMASPSEFQAYLLTQIAENDLVIQLNMWLESIETIDVTSPTLWEDLAAIFTARSNMTVERAAVLVQHIKDGVSQEYIDKALSTVVIGNMHIAQSFTIHYPSLDYVKTSYPISRSTINPDDRSQARFTIGIKTPRSV